MRQPAEWLAEDFCHYVELEPHLYVCGYHFSIHDGFTEDHEFVPMSTAVRYIQEGVTDIAERN